MLLVFQCQRDVVVAHAPGHDHVALLIVGDVACRNAPGIARGPVAGMELIGIGRDVVAAHQSQIVQTGVQRASRGSESHGEACLHLSVLILQQGVGDGIFGIVEAVDRPLHLSRDDDVGNLRSVDHQRGLAPIVGCREAAHHSQSVALLSGVVERVLHIAARLGIAIALAVVVARARIRRVVVLMSGLALLFAGCHKVDGACLQCLVGRLGLCHVAVGEVC